MEGSIDAMFDPVPSSMSHIKNLKRVRDMARLADTRPGSVWPDADIDAHQGFFL
jgi:hypothetical protein